MYKPALAKGVTYLWSLNKSAAVIKEIQQNRTINEENGTTNNWWRELSDHPHETSQQLQILDLLSF